MIAKVLLLMTLTAPAVNSLHVIQHLDSMQIPPNTYIALGNANDISRMTERNTEFS